MSNLQMQNYSSGAVFNIRYTRRMVLLSIDFSFYNEMNLPAAGTSAVLYFNTFFATVKRICTRYNGEFLHIDGDTCVFGFGQYCGINPELIVCRCAIHLQQELCVVMHDILPAENVYTRIAIHSADVNIAAFNETMRFRSHICGPHIALLQQMMNVGQINDILLSESVYRIVAPYTETEYLTDVSTRCIPKMSVYQLQNLCAPLYQQPEYIDAIGSEIRERLHHLTEKKNPDDKVLILEKAHDNLDVDFFDRFYADKTESLFVYHCVANDYGRNFYYDILNDLYNITESILLDNNLPENERLTQYVDYLKQVFNFNPTDYKTIVGYKAALYSFVMALNTLSSIRPTVIIVENIDLLDNESVGILNHLMASTKKSSVYFVFTSEGKLDNLECRMSSYLPVPNMNLTELESYLSSFVSGDSDYMRSLTEYVYRITHGQMWYTDELLSYLKSNNLLTKLPPPSYIPTDMDEFMEKRFEAVNDEEHDVLEVISLLGAFVELDFLRYTHPGQDILLLVRSLSDKGILRIVRHNQYTAVTFCRDAYGEMIRDNLTDEEKRVLHSRIAEAYVAAYPHNLPKFYEKLAYHYQCADILDKAVYYVFCTAVNYREQKENSKARDLLLSAIVLGKEIQDEDENELHYFTNKYVV